MLLPLLLSLSVFALLLTYQLLRPSLRCRPVDHRPVVRVYGRITGPKEPGEVVYRVDDPAAAGTGDAELPLILERHGQKVQVLARGAVLQARWPRRRPELRVGDAVGVAGVVADLRRDEALYREPGCAYGLEALRIVVGGLPRVRGLTVALVAAGALSMGCLMLTLSPLVRYTVPLVGLPCPPGTRLTGRPAVMGSADWTQTCRDRRGKAQGPTVAWSAAGTRQRQGRYRDGQLHGPWFEWRGPGRKRVEGAFVAGKRHGPWTEWGSSGRLRSRGRYQRGKKHGRWTVWRGVCTDRGARLPHAVDGSYPHRLDQLGEALKMHCTYRDDRLHGAFALWLKVQGTQLAGSFRGGEYHGRWTWRDAAGTRLMQSDYGDGRAHGRWIRWSAQGKRVLQGSYTKGEMSGRWIRHRADGTTAWSCAYGDGLAAGWLPPCSYTFNPRCRDMGSLCDPRLRDVIPARARARGGLRAAEIERAVYQQLTNVSSCHFYDWSLPDDRPGTVTVDFTVSPTGQVKGAKVLHSTLNNEDVSDCIAEEISRADFPSSARSTRVRYSIKILHALRSAPIFE